MARFDEIMEHDTFKAQLYDLLIQKVKGPARNFVKSANDEDGIEAWKNLHTRYGFTTKTEYSMQLTKLMEVNNPTKKLQDLTDRITEWKREVEKLGADSPSHAMTETIQRHVLVEKLCANFPKIKEELRTNAAKYERFEMAKN